VSQVYYLAAVARAEENTKMQIFQVSQLLSSQFISADDRVQKVAACPCPVGACAARRPPAAIKSPAAHSPPAQQLLCLRIRLFVQRSQAPARALE